MTHAKDASPGGRLRFITMAVCCGCLFTATLVPQERKSTHPSAKASQGAGPTTAEGQRIFASSCAGCHGLDGRGGERAPDIATNTKTQRRSDEELLRIVERGVPGTGMPAFSSLRANEARSVVRHLRFLQGTNSSAAELPGDSDRGHALFHGKARCAECHGVAGAGGFVAADLTTFGATRSVEEIRDAITKPSGGNRLGGQVTVTTRDGKKYSGVVRNEDNFSLQVQALDGAFHLFLKSEIESLSRDPASLMPSDYGSTLSPSELNDLISFLMSTARAGTKDAPASRKIEGEEEDE
jgi:cytochrome c oxidase cbb3-type subunit III